MVNESLRLAQAGAVALDARAEQAGARNLKKLNGARPPLPQGISGRTLLESDMAEPIFLIEPWAPEGLILLAGRPKLGKTTLLRQKSVAIATGGLFFGEPCKKSKVLFLSLEENIRLMRRKLRLARYTGDDLQDIDLHFEWPRGIAGAEEVNRYLKEHPNVRYVVVDSLTKFRELPDRNTPPFMADYEAMQHLHAVVKDRDGCAIEVLHHTRKGKSEDPIDDISGTYGLTAGCDGYFVMRHCETGALLYAGGRMWDRDEGTFSLTRANQRWELGEVPDDLTDDQRYVMELLEKAGGMGPSELAKARQVGRAAAYKMLVRLVDLGKVSASRGVYYVKN